MAGRDGAGMQGRMLSALDDLHDRVWGFAAAIGRREQGSISIPRPVAPRHVEVDICIITHCGFPGGNAATTVTEARTFASAGYSVAIIHCSIKKSRWKWNWVSGRYLPVMDMIVPAHRVGRITCRKAIVRGPRMMMNRNFLKLSKRIEPGHAIFVVNNSAWSEDGKPVFSWPGLHESIRGFDWPSVELCPTGPIIREESSRDLANTDTPSQLSRRDWPPVMDQSEFAFRPRAKLTPPIVIGRHARDHPGKWLEDREELLAVYPADDPDIRVSILGGAETVAKLRGGVPQSWTVIPFGLGSVRDYLDGLDIFVNFPSPMRHEAFGRTIIEASLSGLPVILPHRFEATFGDLAIYCTPDEVRDVIDRVAADDTGRLIYLKACRELAEKLFCTPSLIQRLEDNRPSERPTLNGPAAAWRTAIQPQS
ncbi:hypothetical protein JSE7799_00574 [Jannaschia seosinensis]|uniref:Glycosyl transferases group 1 n=1 Tax=Jannaschia seosinensis TaxID=313367 RepID=A0A0M7B7B0_9RHOB|nr:glycosyltransferase family 4 protein [Jannaschia seosinensis]CUH21785.1 hypothetical protein JSE7799_00574 [Jannaschia seosinensis]